MRGARGLPLVVDVGRVDRQHLPLEPPLRPGLLRPLLGRQAELVAVRAGDAPVVGDPLRRFELRDVLVGLEVALGQRPARAGLDRRAERHPAHRLHAAPERGVDHARRDQRGGQVRGLLRRSTLRVDRGGGDGDREPGRQPRGAGNVERLLTGLAHAPADDLPDVLGVDAGALHGGALHGTEELGGVDGREPTVAAPERGADGFDEDDVGVLGHGQPPGTTAPGTPTS